MIIRAIKTATMLSLRDVNNHWDCVWRSSQIVRSLMPLYSLIQILRLKRSLDQEKL